MKNLERFVGAIVLFVVVGCLILLRASSSDFMQKLGELGVTKFIDAMKTQSDFQERLEKSQGTATLFIPSDVAMNAWPELNKFMNTQNARFMRRFLKYTVVMGDLTVDQCVQKERHVTADGTEVVIKKDGSDIVLIDGKDKKSKVIKSDIKFSNGYINVIDSALLPKDLNINELQ